MLQANCAPFRSLAGSSTHQLELIYYAPSSPDGAPSVELVKLANGAEWQAQWSPVELDAQRERPEKRDVQTGRPRLALIVPACWLAGPQLCFRRARLVTIAPKTTSDRCPQRGRDEFISVWQFFSTKRQV